MQQQCIIESWLFWLQYLVIYVTNELEEIRIPQGKINEVMFENYVIIKKRLVHYDRSLYMPTRSCSNNATETAHRSWKPISFDIF